MEQSANVETGQAARRPGELSPARRLFWNILGTVALAAGVVGVAVPLLPTTPFVLAAAGCYLRGSSRMHRLLVANRLFGKVLCDYQEGRGISWRVRLASLTFLWASLAGSFLLFPLPALALPLLVAVGAAVSFHVVRLPFKRS